MVAEVSMTMSYTLVSGVWKLVEDLNSNRSELTVSTFVKMARAYNMAIGNYFAHVMPHFDGVQPGQNVNPKLSFCLGKVSRRTHETRGEERTERRGAH